MPSLFMSSVLLTMVGIAFPPILILAAVFWFFTIRTGRRNIARVREKRVSKALKYQQNSYDKAVRFFQ